MYILLMSLKQQFTKQIELGPQEMKMMLFYVCHSIAVVKHQLKALAT